ncbi:M20/M25/M40 family metallo-hydrolase [Desulfitobacterium sp. THU1]|uniref:M20/M25/M40 family metallo-hydrolase n=1 Tax=Desulfitobacterium sp. THU1 TaxID=3138072 RepID=UPI0031202307
MDMKKTMATLMASEPVKKALAFLEKDAEYTLKQQLELVQVPAFTGQEEERAKYFQKLIEAEGYKTELDEVWNIFTTIPGTGDGPTVLISAHLDTVFPPETPLNIRYEGSKIYCPGISDDTRGLTEMLTILRAFREVGIRPIGDIIIGGNVGEEGLGNSRGMRHIFGKPNNIDGFISVDGACKALIIGIAGILRYKVTFRGRGGHAMGDHGMPNPIYAMGQAISGISNLPEAFAAPWTDSVSGEPWTTFNVGLINGGQSVNTIAEECSMLIEIRSVKQDKLDEVTQRIMAIINQAVNNENRRRENKPELSVSVEIKELNKKPAGWQPTESPMVQAGFTAYEALNQTLDYPTVGTGDSCIPLSMGIPAVVTGAGGTSANFHKLNEWFDPTDAHLGAFKNLLYLLALVGLDGVSAPTLPKRNK